MVYQAICFRVWGISLVNCRGIQRRQDTARNMDRRLAGTASTGTDEANTPAIAAAARAGATNRLVLFRIVTTAPSHTDSSGVSRRDRPAVRADGPEPWTPPVN